ncbi:hypothetical protein [Metabacillus litoralis]|uniref:hypothetical protein n=1 Tax=Metabacillus litoralis TaxID=152268 RepID=UPI001CFD8E88|nr:hypothetical protein [Metabacillus litoralis]
MSSFMKIILTAVLILMIFLVGFFTGKFTSNETTREIMIGYEHKEHLGQIDFKQRIKDSEDQAIVDNFMMIFMNKNKINIQEDLENPDVYLFIKSPKQSTLLIESKVWFTNKGAKIGIRSGETWDQVKYYNINESDAKYIREHIDFN